MWIRRGLNPQPDLLGRGVLGRRQTCIHWHPCIFYPTIQTKLSTSVHTLVLYLYYTYIIHVLYLYHSCIILVLHCIILVLYCIILVLYLYYTCIILISVVYFFVYFVVRQNKCSCIRIPFNEFVYCLLPKNKCYERLFAK